MVYIPTANKKRKNKLKNKIKGGLQATGVAKKLSRGYRRWPNYLMVKGVDHHQS